MQKFKARKVTTMTNTTMTNGTINGIAYTCYSQTSHATCNTSQVSEETNNREQRAEKPEWLNKEFTISVGDSKKSNKRRSKKSKTAKQSLKFTEINAEKPKAEVSNTFGVTKKTEPEWVHKEFTISEADSKKSSKRSTKKNSKKSNYKPEGKKSKIMRLEQKVALLNAEISKAKADKKRVSDKKAELAKCYAELATLV